MPSDASQLLLYDIQRFCVHDGPGIRTVVFFKGCPLRCRWCQNPESLSSQPQVAFYAERCVQCMACEGACPNGAIRAGVCRVDREACQSCGVCADACPHEALRLVGWRETSEKVLEQILSDKPYFDATGGGLSLSGGEPLLQADAAAGLLKGCKAHGIHTLIETCGHVPWNAFECVLDWTDRFYFDLKAPQNALHREGTGVTGERIFRNAGRLLEAGADVVFRTPVVPGFNDGLEALEGLAAFLKGHGRETLRLLRYHGGGESKYDRLDLRQAALGISAAQADEAIDEAMKRLESMGIRAIIEGDEPASVDRQDEPIFPDRVWRLRKAVQSAKPAVCPERALLVTAYFKQRGNRRKPPAIRKAEALRHILKKRSAHIYEDELLVGNFSSKRVGGSILPELHGTAVLLDLFAFEKRPVNALDIRSADRRVLLTKVLPFWAMRSLAAKAFPLPRAVAFAAHQLKGKEYLINETGGISHYVPDYEKLLRQGARGIADEAALLERSAGPPEKRQFYRAVQIVCEALEDFAAPYARMAQEEAEKQRDPKRRKELEAIAGVCQRVPAHPARTLQEAFQSILFAQIALNLESLDNSICPGRLDQLLYPYYKADIEAGRLDENGARDLVGCFTVKMSEIVPVFSKAITRFIGGMLNGQVVVVGGQTPAGDDGTNALTWIFLDAMDALRMRQPNYHARIHAASPPSYVGRIAQMLLKGSGAPSLMNDECVVPMLEGRGMERADALDYSPVGCVEPAACGKTFGSTDAALMNLALCLERALGLKKGGAPSVPASSWTTMEDGLAAFQRQVEHLVDRLIDDIKHIERANAVHHPTPLASMLLQGCMEQGIDSTAGGVRYNASGIQAVGVADVADSLAAIEQVVFQQGRCSMEELLRALKADFAGSEDLLGYLGKAPKYGNEAALPDRLMARIMGIYSDALSRHENTRGGPYLAGFYSVTAHVAFGETTGTLPSGRLAGRSLANGLSPANGVERLGPTASLNSVACQPLAEHARNGINVNLKIDPTFLAGDTGIQAMSGLLRGYFAKGGMQVQTNVVDPRVLIEARDNPASHPWLLVRVSGYSAYFNDLCPGMKQELIDRSLHGGDAGQTSCDNSLAE